MKRCIALAVLVLVGGKAFAQSLGYGYPSMPSVHQAAAGGGAAATASPTATPSPAFIGAVSQAVPTTLATPALPTGTHAGDCAVAVASMSNTATLDAGFWPQWGIVQTDTANWTAGGKMNTMERIITPSDVTAGKFSITLDHTQNALCIAVFRYVTCSNDQIAALASGTSTAPRPGSITTTVNGDAIVSLGLMNVGVSAPTYTTPSGYTNATFLAPVPSTSFGCYIDYKTGNQSTAGATQPAAGTLSISNDWGAVQFALINRGGTP